MKKTPHPGVVKFLKISIGFIILSLFLSWIYLTLFTCELTKLKIRRQLNPVHSVTSVLITRSIVKDRCWMHVTVALRDKGEVVWPIFTEGNNQFEASFPNEKLKVLSLNALREQRRSNRDDTFLSGRYNIVTDFKVIPYEIGSPSELLARYEEIVQLGLTEKAKGISEDAVPTDVDHAYFVVYKFRDSD